MEPNPKNELMLSQLTSTMIYDMTNEVTYLLAIQFIFTYFIILN